MSNEELMKPRWKVIADYPGSDYHIGEILDRDWGWVGNDEIGFKHQVSHYPHLFKKLEWWEEKNIADIPIFIKDVRDNSVVKIIKQASHTPSDVFIEIIKKDLKNIYQWVSLFDMVPSTLEEWKMSNIRIKVKK